MDEQPGQIRDYRDLISVPNERLDALLTAQIPEALELLAARDAAREYDCSRGGDAGESI